MATRTDRRAGRLGRFSAPFLVGAGALAAVTALHLRDPHRPGSWGVCPVQVLTGWNCPGCGGLRAVHHLTDGDLVAAASSNLLVVLLVPLAIAGWLVWARRAWRGGPPLRLEWSTPVAVAVLGLVLGFAVLRNLGIGSWLAA